MAYAPKVLAVLLVSGVTLAGCKKEQEPETIPVGAASGAASIAAEQPAASAAAAPTATATTPPPPPQTTPQPRPTGVGIDACCSAINAVKSSGKDAISKGKAAAAAQACPGISEKVKNGSTSRAAAITLIKSQLQGLNVPECN